MDPTRFDRLTKSLTTSDTRRGLLRLLTGFPLVAALAVQLEGTTEARKGRGGKARGDRHDADDRHKKKRKRRRLGKHKGPDVCNPPCSICQRCEGTSCVADATREGDSCNSVGGACLRNGTCLTPCQLGPGGSGCPFGSSTCSGSSCSGSTCCSGAFDASGAYCSPGDGSGTCANHDDCPMGSYCRNPGCVVACTG